MPENLSIAGGLNGIWGLLVSTSADSTDRPKASVSFVVLLPFIISVVAETFTDEDDLEGRIHKYEMG